MFAPACRVRCSRLLSSSLLVAGLLVLLHSPAQAQLFGGGKKPPPPVILNQPDTVPALSELVMSAGKNITAKRLAIASFSVEFSTEHTVSAGGSSGTGSSAQQTTEVILKGLEPKHFQAITDEAYTAFIAAARSAGFDVVGRDELVGHEAYKAAMPAGKPSGLVKESGGLKLLAYAPSGMVLNGMGLAPGATDYVPSGGAFGAITQVASIVGNTADAVKSAEALRPLLTALGDAQLLQVRLTLYFAELKGEFGQKGNVITAGTHAKLGLYVDLRNTVVALADTSQDCCRNFNLKRALLVDGKPFTGTEDVSPTGRNVATNVGLALLGSLAGGRSSSSVKVSRFEVKADPDTYVQLSGVALQGAARLLTEAMKGTP